MSRTFRTLCVFCGSRTGGRTEYAEAARALGAELAARGIGIVYGGGRLGLMGTLADAALAGGGRVTGVIPEALVARELGHTGTTELKIVPSMHARKALMAELADGFIALPGGYGTFEELFEVVTWAQLGIHDKPIGLLDVAGYFRGILSMVDHAVAEGFIQEEQRSLVVAAATLPELLERMSTAPRPPLAQWVLPEES
jgi:uncharacterized protein (TIGR00730 family)